MDLVFLAFGISRNRVISTPTPGMASGDPFNGQPKSLEQTMLFKSLNGVMGTSGCETALRTQPWGNDPLIDFYQ